ncbi:trypsin-1-like [Leguminivora glycinivorella]|uniref:trypsin-1-like n=1 Tax=Leguminivora glycinivorella TaxID=1035111 RepID=UPI00200CF771|nr:trypsin-1-like [Leguminivora glycinivorella]
MAVQIKMALMFLLAGRALCGHDQDNADSDNIESRELYRRSWQYEGIPYEVAVARRRRQETKGEEVSDQSNESSKITSITTSAPEIPQNIHHYLHNHDNRNANNNNDHNNNRRPRASAAAPRYRRIYNSDETARIEQHPYLAAVLMNNQLWCGGAIISSDLVLTAAHCLQLQYNNRFFREYVKMLTVRIGSSNATAGGEVLRVDEIFFHPNYKPDTLAFNYAVVRLHKNITFSALNVSKIEYSKRKDVTIDKTITFLGWGSVLGMGDKGGAVLLQKVDLPVYDKADCIDVYGKELVSFSTFCAGFISKIKNVCNHDAGGPAIMDGQLVGILSFSAKRCDEADKPAVFASTGAAAEWLDSIPVIRKKSEDLARGWMNGIE